MVHAGGTQWRYSSDIWGERVLSSVPDSSAQAMVHNQIVAIGSNCSSFQILAFFSHVQTHYASEHAPCSYSNSTRALLWASGAFYSMELDIKALEGSALIWLSCLLKDLVIERQVPPPNFWTSSHSLFQSWGWELFPSITSSMFPQCSTCHFRLSLSLLPFAYIKNSLLK